MQKGGAQTFFILGALVATIAVIGVFGVFGPFFGSYRDVPAQRPGNGSSMQTYIEDEEVVMIESASGTNENPTIVDHAGKSGGGTSSVTMLPVTRPSFQYVEVTDSCPHDFSGECVNIRAGPGTDFASVKQLRNGQVLKVGGQVERGGRTWYKLVFHPNEWLRYPERITSDWYVAGDFVTELYDEGPRDDFDPAATGTTKRIVVDKSEQTLYAYADEDSLVMTEPISTGLELTPTPNGTFAVFRKTPSRYMQGPIPGLNTAREWDLPGVPWVMYFTHGGAAIHGTYWHNNFGEPSSAGCVNLSPEQARQLYQWAELGTTVVIRE